MRNPQAGDLSAPWKVKLAEQYLDLLSDHLCSCDRVPAPCPTCQMADFIAQYIDREPVRRTRQEQDEEEESKSAWRKSNRIMDNAAHRGDITAYMGERKKNVVLIRAMVAQARAPRPLTKKEAAIEASRIYSYHHLLGEDSPLTWAEVLAYEEEV